MSIKVVCVSDTHLRHDFYVPSGDILVHAGDLLTTGKYFDEADNAAAWLLWLSGKFKHTVLTPGNHDWLFQTNEAQMRSLFNGVHILIDQGVELTVRKQKVFVYGTPSQPAFMNWAFNHTTDEMHKYYRRIPNGVDILVTHCPPRGILDVPIYNKGKHKGSEELLEYVQRAHPRLHVFGHMHWPGGQRVDVGGTTFVNAAICDEQYEPTHKAVTVEI